jgi:hypothetical protein
MKFVQWQGQGDDLAASSEGREGDLKEPPRLTSA